MGQTFARVINSVFMSISRSNQENLFIPLDSSATTSGSRGETVAELKSTFENLVQKLEHVRRLYIHHL
jgi:hypothetical protein